MHLETVRSRRRAERVLRGLTVFHGIGAVLVLALPLVLVVVLARSSGGTGSPSGLMVLYVPCLPLAAILALLAAGLRGRVRFALEAARFLHTVTLSLLGIGATVASIGMMVRLGVGGTEHPRFWLLVGLWALAAGEGVISSLLYFGGIKGLFLPDPTRCPACGYDLTGLKREACPECGWRKGSAADDDGGDGG